MPDKLLKGMEEQRFGPYLNMKYKSSNEYDMKIVLKLIFIPTYQVPTMDPMVFCVDTEAPISCIGDNALKKIIYSVDLKSISMILSDRNFQFWNTEIKSQGMVELPFPT